MRSADYMRLILLFSAIMLLIAGCSGPSEEGIDEITVHQGGDSPPPTPTSVVPPVDSASESSIPTPSADIATIYGRLMLLDPTVLSPQEDGLYLVPIDSESEQMMVVPVIVEGEAIQAQIDETTGDFVFTDVEAGHYVLMAMLDTGQERVVHRLGTNEHVLPVVTEEDLGGAIDLGIVSLP
jgi:hypothetical protein